jgi:ABC-type uncharacterized transport system substrate-binding protein
MERRKFITLVGATASAWTLPASAQKQVMPVIGVLESGTETSPTSMTPEFHAGLKTLGFAEGQNVTIEYRRAETQYARLPALAAELIDRQVAVLVASGNFAAAVAAKAATRRFRSCF